MFVIVCFEVLFLLFFSFVLALPICTRVGYTYTCQCVCKCVFRVEIKGLPLGSFCSHFLRQVVSLNLELTNSALLDSQQALPTLLSMPSQGQDCKHIPPCRASSHGAWQSTPRSYHLPGYVLYQLKHSLSPKYEVFIPHLYVWKVEVEF